MLNFNRRDAVPETKDLNNKGALRPAIYEPPGSDLRARADAAGKPVPAADGTTVPVLTEKAAGASATATPAAPVSSSPVAGSKLFVGPGIKLEGVAVNDCDLLVIEGHVEATIHSKAMEIAPPGTLSGTACIDVADIHGEFTGELTARTRLTIHGTGRVSGVVRYGSLIVAEGAVLAGDVQRIDGATPTAADATARATPAPAPAARPALGPSGERSAH